VGRKALLVIAPAPPPYTGMELATQALLAELDAAGLPYEHVNISDPADALGNRGAWTARNAAVAVGNIMSAARKTVTRNISAVYVPIAQEFPALFRDFAFLEIARLAGRPTIVHLHGGAFADFYGSLGPTRRRLVKHVVGSAEVGIVLTEQLRPALSCVLPSDRLIVVPNGIDLPEPVDDAGGADDKVRLLFLSSLFRWKGPLLFLEAFAEAKALRPNLHATVAGDWPTSDVQHEAQELVRRLGVEDSIAFVGVVRGSEKARALREADIFCFTSLKAEGQPLVILEAMAAGLPVIATDWPGIADTVIDGTTGLLLHEKNAHALARLIVELVDSPEKRARFGKAGRERYAEFYTQKAFGRRIVQVLTPYIGDELSPEQAVAHEATR
jgi:glycosyltransferase involved in cell wall biosynthesis